MSPRECSFAAEATQAAAITTARQEERRITSRTSQSGFRA
jgi:hypothetical protein